MNLDQAGEAPRVRARDDRLEAFLQYDGALARRRRGPAGGRLVGCVDGGDAVRNGCVRH